jgi:hypothetical protein
MKHLIISLSLAAGFMALSTMESSAIVCARGVYHAGCVATGGAVAVGRPVACYRLPFHLQPRKSPAFALFASARRQAGTLALF